MIPDPLALALRELRNSPDTEAAGWRDAEDARTLRTILQRLGHAIVPQALDAGMRAAIWRAQAERLVHTPASRPAYARFRLDSPHQAEIDAAAWEAMLAEVASRA